MSDNSKKEDRRVTLTKAILREALVEAIKEKPIDKITVTELCKRAKINRNTFYSHYASPRDVLSEIQDDFLRQLLPALGHSTNGSIIDMIREMCRIMQNNRKLCKVLFSPNGDSAFVDNLVLSCKGRVLYEWKKAGFQIPPENIDLVFSFIVEGSRSLLGYWIMNDVDASVETISGLLSSLSYRGLKSFGRPRNQG